MAKKTTGQAPFVFSLCEDLYTLPDKAQKHEVDLHGGFATDTRAGQGEVYYGMPGCGLMRIAADLSRQDILELPPELKPLNFHSTKIGEFDGNLRLFMPANNDEKVAILTLDGDVDFVLSRPEFDEYADAEAPYKPTDTVLHGEKLYVADGYGSNYISSVDMHTHGWSDIFGGKSDDPNAVGRFGTAHGINNHPDGQHLTIADRPHARLVRTTTSGEQTASYGLPAGSFPCGINYADWRGKTYAVVGSLRDPVPDRPAPIYILDGDSHELLSTLRPKEELGVELATHIHNTVFHIHNDQLYLIVQAWNPGHYFVLALE